MLLSLIQIFLFIIPNTKLIHKLHFSSFYNKVLHKRAILSPSFTNNNKVLVILNVLIKFPGKID